MAVLKLQYVNALTALSAILCLNHVDKQCISTHLTLGLFHKFQNTSLHTTLDVVTSELKPLHQQGGSAKQETSQ